jgi:amino acid adenylation domain-containing protein
MAEPVTALARFLHHARSQPLAPAVEQDGAVLSYAGLADAATNRAAELAAHGARRGSRIAIEACYGADYAIALLAAWLLAAVAVPVDPAAPASRRRFQVRQARCDAAATGPASDEVVAQEAATVAAEGAAARDEAAVPAYILFTSGSTGTPKGVVAEHPALVNVLDHFVRSMRLRPGHRMLAHSNPAFDMSLFETVLPLISGGCIAAAPRRAGRDPELFASWLCSRPPDVAAATPSQLALLLPFLRGRRAFGTLISGGEAITAALAQDLTAIAAVLWNGYGPTETTVAALATELLPPLTDPMPIGLPVSGLGAHVLDEARQPVPRGAVGELCLSGIGLTRGYVGEPEQTARVFVAGPGGERIYRTGDLVRVRPDGQFCFHGRLDDQVKIRGYRVELGEIEAVAQRDPSVSQAAALVCDVMRHQPDLYLAVAAVPGSALQSGALRDHLRRLLPAYMQPHRVLFFSELPRNVSGKVDRAAVRLLVEDRLRADVHLEGTHHVC